MKPNDKLKALKRDDALGRVLTCQAMLYFHGFLTESENSRIKDRIRKWVTKHSTEAAK